MDIGRGISGSQRNCIGFSTQKFIKIRIDGDPWGISTYQRINSEVQYNIPVSVNSLRVSTFFTLYCASCVDG